MTNIPAKLMQWWLVLAATVPAVSGSNGLRLRYWQDDNGGSSLKQGDVGEDNELVLDTKRVELFFESINAELERRHIRGAAYAFRGPGMNETLMGTFGRVSGSSDSALVDKDTTFNLASISKTVTGAAVAVLIDRGLLSLDDDICNVLGGPVMIDGEINTACRNPYFPDTNVTWRMLVTHRSSINRDVGYIDENTTAEYGPTGANYPVNIVGNPTCPLNDTLQFFDDLFVNKTTQTTVGNIGYSVDWYQLVQDTMGGVWNDTYAPGEKHVYSNIAVAYIAALIEKLIGKKFDQFCRENVFVPAGMNHTSWFREDLPQGTLEAVPVYAYDEFIGTWEDVGHVCYITYASGQLYSSINDMSRYADIMLSYGIGTLWSNITAMDHVFGCQERGALGNLLSDNSLECTNALSWFHLSNAKRDSLNDDSLSNEFVLQGLDWTNGIAHQGDEVGVATEIMILPEAMAYAIVLLNTNGADQSYFMNVITLEGMALVNGEPPVGVGGYGYYYDEWNSTIAPIS